MIDTKTVEIPATDTERMHLMVSVWNQLMENETMRNGTIIDIMDTLVMRVEDAIKETTDAK